MRKHVFHVVITLMALLVALYSFDQAAAVGTHAVKMADGTQGTQVDLSIWMLPSVISAVTLIFAVLAWVEKILRYGNPDVGIFNLGKIGKILGV